MDFDFLKQNKIIPVVVIDDINDAIPKLSALERGGIHMAEITFRTSCAPQVLKLACEVFPCMTIGAGTVITAEQCNCAIDAGAKYIVSPGLSAAVAEICIKANIPYIAGVATATEIITAKKLGLTTLKFFPAEAAGGIKMLKALSSAFPDVSFVPTGGLNENNFCEYLECAFVTAVGGSWMLKGSAAEIEKSTYLAVQRAKEISK